MIIQSIYYHYCRDWWYLHVVGVVEALLIIAAASQIPESPKYLYAQKRFNEVRTIMKRIARHNKCKITTG